MEPTNPIFPLTDHGLQWTTAEGPNDGVVFVTSMSAYWYVGQHHIYLRTSADGGASWSAIKQIDTTGYSVGSLTVSYGGISIGKQWARPI